MTRLIPLVLLLAACTATPRSAQPSAHPDAARSGAPWSHLPAAPHSHRPAVANVATSEGTAGPDVRYTGTAADVTIEGIASWVAPRYGYATWYDDGPGFYGAVRSWHYGDEPYAVQVCRADKPTTCTHVVVRDYCACGSRKGEPTLIDLSPAAFRELAALSRGVVRVTVDDVGVALPETDQEEP